MSKNPIRALLSCLIISMPYVVTPAASFSQTQDYVSLIAKPGQFVAAQRGAVGWSADSGYIRLRRGSLVVSSTGSCWVASGKCYVNVDKHGTALVQRARGRLTVTNLADFRKESIRVVAGPVCINLRPGQRILLTSHEPSLPEIFAEPRIGQRCITVTEIPGAGWITTSDVNMLDVLKHEALIAELRKQGKSRPEREVGEQITRTTAILAIVLGSREPFQYAPPSMVADVSAISGTKTRAGRDQDFLQDKE